MSTFEFVIINSKDRNNADLDNAAFTITEAINGNYAVNKLVMTNNFYNVSSNNNKIYFNDGTDDRVGTISPGIFTYDLDFCSALSNAMDNASGMQTYSISIDTNNKLSISQDSGDFTLTFGTNTDNSANEIMGFDSADTSATNTKISDSPINLNYPKALFININDIASESSYITSSFPFSYVVPNTSGYGDIISYNDIITSLYINFSSPEELVVKFYDKDGNQLSLNGSEYTLILQKIEA